MLRKTAVMLALLIISTFVTVCAADKYAGYEIPVDIEVNGKFIKCVEKPFIENGSTYIPLRAFSDAVNGQIEWDENTNTATMIKDGHIFEFCAENNYCIIDGIKQSCYTINYKNLTFIPVRAVSETLNYTVEWDNDYFTVKITAPEVDVPEACCDYSYTYEDILYLSKIAMLESGSNGIEMKIGICNTILNRVNSNSFPDTVKDVIFDTNYGVQFPPVHTEKINNIPSAECVIAAKCALNNVNLAGNSLYFISTKAAPSSWAHQNRAYYTTIGNTNFYE